MESPEPQLSTPTAAASSSSPTAARIASGRAVPRPLDLSGSSTPTRAVGVSEADPSVTDAMDAAEANGRGEDATVNRVGFSTAAGNDQLQAAAAADGSDAANTPTAAGEAYTSRDPRRFGNSSFPKRSPRPPTTTFASPGQLSDRTSIFNPGAKPARHIGLSYNTSAAPSVHPTPSSMFNAGGANKSAAETGSRFLLTVVPPAHLPHDPPHPRANPQASGYGPPQHFRYAVRRLCLSPIRADSLLFRRKPDEAHLFRSIVRCLRSWQQLLASTVCRRRAVSSCTSCRRPIRPPRLLSHKPLRYLATAAPESESTHGTCCGSSCSPRTMPIANDNCTEHVQNTVPTKARTRTVSRPFRPYRRSTLGTGVVANRSRVASRARASRRTRRDSLFRQATARTRRRKSPRCEQLRMERQRQQQQHKLRLAGACRIRHRHRAPNRHAESDRCQRCLNGTALDNRCTPYRRGAALYAAHPRRTCTTLCRLQPLLRLTRTCRTRRRSLADRPPLRSCPSTAPQSWSARSSSTSTPQRGKASGTSLGWRAQAPHRQVSPCRSRVARRARRSFRRASRGRNCAFLRCSRTRCPADEPGSSLSLSPSLASEIRT